MRLGRWISSQMIQLRSLVQIRPAQLQFISFQLFPSTPQPRPRDSSERNGSKSESKEKQNYGMAEETKKRLDLLVTGKRSNGVGWAELLALFDAGATRERKGRKVSLGTVCDPLNNLPAVARKKAGIQDSGLVNHQMVAGVRFELTTFGLCDLTQLSLRVGLYLHPE